MLLEADIHADMAQWVRVTNKLQASLVQCFHTEQTIFHKPENNRQREGDRERKRINVCWRQCILGEFSTLSAVSVVAHTMHVQFRELSFSHSLHWMCAHSMCWHSTRGMVRFRFCTSFNLLHQLKSISVATETLPFNFVVYTFENAQSIYNIRTVLMLTLKIYNFTLEKRKNNKCHYLCVCLCAAIEWNNMVNFSWYFRSL